jgi:hypothetical protein
VDIEETDEPIITVEPVEPVRRPTRTPDPEPVPVKVPTREKEKVPA